MPAPLYISGKCKICDQPAHGCHFGVMSCRACAAFFRRAASKNYKALHLVCEKGNCVLFNGEKYNCKKCRLKKCHDVGMDSSKFQTDRDLISSSNVFWNTKRVTSPQSLSNFLGRPEFILCCEPDKSSPIKTFIDVSFLIEKARKIFRESSSEQLIPYKIDNSLERLTYAMENMRMKKPNQQMKVLKSIGKPEALFFWEQAILGAANWFSNLSEFAELDMNIKIEILKSAWLLWVRLDRVTETADQQKKKVVDSDVIICGDNACIDMQNFEMDLKWCTNYSVEQMKFYVMPDTEEEWKGCIDEIIQLNPTNVERNFMLLQLCLHDAGKRNQGVVLEATERLLQIQANNLHDYYVKRLKMPRYSDRLAKMMKVNEKIAKDVRKRRDRNEIARVFDIYSIEFSHPEMFECT